ncbi:hypothetical protein PO909_025354 [Leuciscus waleckii]
MTLVPLPLPFFIIRPAGPTQPPSLTYSLNYNLGLNMCIVNPCVSRQSPLQASATPATQSSLSPISPLVPPQPPLSGVAIPRACCEPPPSGRGESVAPPSASERSNPPRSIALAPGPFSSKEHQAFGLPQTAVSDIAPLATNLQAVRCSPAPPLRLSHPHGAVWMPTSMAPPFSATAMDHSSGSGLGHHLPVPVQGHSLDHTTLDFLFNPSPGL